MHVGLSPASAPARGSDARRLWRKAPEVAAVLALVLGCIASQILSGAYRSDFAADSDEPSHVVSSLMVRAYLAHGLGSNPIKFAEQYYVHFPKVGIGHWPPLFYCAEAVWMLVFGASRATLLLLVLCAHIFVVVSVYGIARRRGGMTAATLAGLVALATPAMRRAGITVDPDMMLALLALFAAFLWGCRLSTGRRAFTLAFALLTIACAFTHGRGVLVLLVPLAATLLLKPRALFKARWLLAMALFGVALVRRAVVRTVAANLGMDSAGERSSVSLAQRRGRRVDRAGRVRCRRLPRGPPTRFIAGGAGLAGRPAHGFSSRRSIPAGQSDISSSSFPPLRCCSAWDSTGCGGLPATCRGCAQ